MLVQTETSPAIGRGNAQAAENISLAGSLSPATNGGADCPSSNSIPPSPQNSLDRRDQAGVNIGERELFCEVLNPEGQNLVKMDLALRQTYPAYAEVIRQYAGPRWAEFTWEILSYGHRSISRFVGWPDAGAQCRRGRHW